MKTKKTLKETVVEGIYREIEEGIYKPNDIIHEGEIMEKYAMSKSPVREALIELCKDNVLKSIPRVGYQVVPVTLKEILDLLEFRIDVETGNLRRLCQRITSCFARSVILHPFPSIFNYSSACSADCFSSSTHSCEKCCSNNRSSSCLVSAMKASYASSSLTA